MPQDDEEAKGQTQYKFFTKQDEIDGEWQAEYEFWNKLISDEVARKRHNEGFEPIDCELYELKDSHGQLKKFIGSFRMNGRYFIVTASPTNDSEGQPTLKLSIRVKSRKHN